MFENYIQKYRELLNIDLNENNEKINVSDVLALDMPLQIRRFIENELNRWIGRKIDPELLNGSIEFNDDIETNITALRSELVNKLILNSDQLELLINKAIQSTFNFITRPRTSLLWFAMGENDSCKVYEIKEILNYFTDYDYLTNTMKEKLSESSNSDDISRDEFSEMIEQAGNEHIFNLSPAEMSEITNSLFDCYNFHGMEKNTREVPLESLMIFFEDKALGNLIEKLDELIDLDGKESISKDDLNKLFSSLGGDDSYDQEYIEDQNELDEKDDLSDEISDDIAKELHDTVDDLPDNDNDHLNSDFDFDEEVNKELAEFNNDEIIEEESDKTQIDDEIDVEPEQDELIDDSSVVDIEKLDHVIDDEIESISSDFGIESTGEEIEIEEIEYNEKDLDEFQNDIHSVTKDLI